MMRSKSGTFFLGEIEESPYAADELVHFLVAAADAPGTSDCGFEKRSSPAIPDRLLHIVSFQGWPLRSQRLVEIQDGRCLVSKRGAGIVRLVCAAALLCVTSLASAERPQRVPKPGEFNPADESVEMFAAIEAGQLEVKFIPQNSKQARLFIDNKTSKPLNVRLPDVFAGVPVQAQVLPFPGNRGPNGMNGQMQQGQLGMNQSVGGATPNGQRNGPFGQNNNQGPGNGNGINFFNVPSEKVGEMKIKCVCLEYGKDQPRAVIPYKVVPLEYVTSKPEVAAVLREFGTGQYDQNVAQAAAWHTANDMTWEQLAGAKGELIALGVNKPMFTAQELEAAKKLFAEAEKRMKKTEKEEPSPGKLSQN
jgi:hypothetical protein